MIFNATSAYRLCTEKKH